jgi:outer membrane protein assembly factor BamB
VGSAATTICCGVAIGVSLFLPQALPPAGQVVPPVPAPPPAATAAPPAPAYEPAWQKTIDTDAALQIATGGTQVFVTGAKARLTAFAAADGAEAWSKELPSDVRMATGEGLVFVVSGAKLHALDEKTGVERWSVSLPGPTTGPVWSKGFVVFSNGPELVACRGADGGEIWRLHVGVETAQPVVIESGRVLAVLASKTIVVLDLVTGSVLQRMLPTPVPGELAAAGDRFYFAADDGVFYAYKVNAEDHDWAYPIHVNGVGAPVIDGRCVYAAFLDNAVRAFQRGSGSSCWSTRTLKGRPAAGPLLAGSQLVIPLTTGELVQVVIKDGKLADTPGGAAGTSSQPAASTLQAIAASPDTSTVFMVSVGGDQRRVLTARRRK